MVGQYKKLKTLGRKDRRRQERARSIRREYTGWWRLYLVLRVLGLKRLSYRLYQKPRVKFYEYTDGRLTHIETIRSKPMVMMAKVAGPKPPGKR